MDAAPIIMVGIVSGPALEFELLGEFTVGAAGVTMSGRARTFLHGNTIVIECASHRIENAQEVLLTPVDLQRASFIIRDVTIGVQFHWERKENQRFAGGLRLLASGDRVTAVNNVPVEEYLISVISSEMSAGSSMNLLQAHAITSRSWLLAQIGQSRRLKEHPAQPLVETAESLVRWYDREDHEIFDVCADDHCQRYQGMTKAYTPAVKEAVEKTRGRVLMHEERICDARYSKSCGGISEPFEMVWEPVHVPYLVSVADRDPQGDGPSDVHTESDAQAWIRNSPGAFCNTNDRRILSQILPAFDQETTDFYRWTVTYTQADLAELIRKKIGIDFGRIIDLLPVERGPSGRLSLLKIVGEKKRLTIGKELEIRRTLSPSHLYSSAFVVERSDLDGPFPGKFLLRGAGWGHGVGLCQIGAAVMGEKGYSPEAILKHYFTGAVIKQVYS